MRLVVHDSRSMLEYLTLILKVARNMYSMILVSMGEGFVLAEAIQSFSKSRRLITEQAESVLEYRYVRG